MSTLLCEQPHAFHVQTGTDAATGATCDVQQDWVEQALKL
jgi:hypothetical protein